MANPLPTEHTMVLNIDMEAADNLRALLESLAEALERLTEAARMAQELSAGLLVVQDAAKPTETRQCGICEGTGIWGPDGNPCWKCQGHGLVEVGQPTDLAPIIQTMDAVVSDTVPAQREEPGFTMPTMPRECPECAHGEFQNCTRSLEDGTLCDRYARFLKFRETL